MGGGAGEQEGRLQRSKGSKGVSENELMAFFSPSTDLKWFHCNKFKEFCPAPEIPPEPLRILTLGLSNTSENPGWETDKTNELMEGLHLITTCL